MAANILISPAVHCSPLAGTDFAFRQNQGWLPGGIHITYTINYP